MINSETLLETRNLCVDVHGKQLVKNANFRLQCGEHKVIIGPNGAGKTSLLRALLGSLTASSGSILLSGADSSTLSQGEIAKLISYVPQLLAAEIPYTVREFVGMGRYAHAGGHLDEAVDDAIAAVGVEGFVDRVVSTLSGGERQRVCIAAALAQKAPILILDEPLVHLDPSQRLEVQRVLRELPEEVTIMVVTHDIDWAKSDFQSLLTIKDGQIDYDGEVANFFNKDGITHLFGDAVGRKYRRERV